MLPDRHGWAADEVCWGLISAADFTLLCPLWIKAIFQRFHFWRIAFTIPITFIYVLAKGSSTAHASSISHLIATPVSDDGTFVLLALFPPALLWTVLQCYRSSFPWFSALCCRFRVCPSVFTALICSGHKGATAAVPSGRLQQHSHFLFFIRPVVVLCALRPAIRDVWLSFDDQSPHMAWHVYTLHPTEICFIPSYLL